MTKFYTQETQTAIWKSEAEAEKFQEMLEAAQGEFYDYPEEEED
jgi:hypothetical protein